MLPRGRSQQRCLGGRALHACVSSLSGPAEELVCPSLQILSSANGTLDEAAAIARGVTLTRYLVESPPNVATPSYLAEAAAMIADEFPEAGAACPCRPPSPQILPHTPHE